MKSLILIVVITFLLAMVASDRKRPVVRSNSLIQRRSSRTLDCFNYYLPKIEAIAKKYEQEYNACVEGTKSGRCVAESATLEKRTDLANRAEDACQLVSNCSEMQSPEQIFECFAEGGSENAKIMYLINVDSSEYLADLQEEFRLIINKEYRCTNETKRTYERDSAQAYEELNNCISGISEVQPPTEAPVEPNDVTEAPIETTKPPEIDAFKAFRNRVREFFHKIRF
ncbi:uncharacterized protein ACRADG_007834 [Cochliomyia hominivorax]